MSYENETVIEWQVIGFLACSTTPEIRLAMAKQFIAWAEERGKTIDPYWYGYASKTDWFDLVVRAIEAEET